MQSIVTLALFAGAAVAAHVPAGNYTQPAPTTGVPDKTITEVVETLITTCPTPTTFSTNGKTFTVTSVGFWKEVWKYQEY